MTHSVDSPFPPPPAATDPSAKDTAKHEAQQTKDTAKHEAQQTKDTAKHEAQQTKDTAKHEAQNVGQTAQQAGSQVAATATDQAQQVASETQRQAKDLVDQGRSQLREQAVAQQQKAAQGVSSLAQELRSLANGTSEGAPGPARDLIEQASSKAEEFAGWLENREPADLLEEVRSFARRKSGTFLLGAAAAGVLAGRLTGGLKAAHSSDSGSEGQHRATPHGNYVHPGPAYADDTTSEYPTTATGTPGTGAPLPPPPYGTVPPAGSAVPPTAPAGWDDPARRPGEVR